MSPIPIETPRYVIWELTRACNLKCHHCASGAGKPRRNELTKEEALGICDQLVLMGAPAVCLMGGEVLLREDWTARDSLALPDKGPCPG